MSQARKTSTATTPAVTPIAYNRHQAAAALAISPRKLDELAANTDSGLPLVRVGRKVLFPVEQLQAWFTERIGSKV